MIPWFLAYIVVALALFGVALYEHINSTTLSLPISPALTIITVILPFAAVINAFFYRRLIASDSRPHHILARALQIAQGILTTALATLLFSNILPSAARDCLLSTIWQRLFSSHDAEAIRRIQDALNCCGYNTVRDRAWPFPNQHTAQQCAETYGRDTACIQPWSMALQRNSGFSFGIVLLIGLFQIAIWFPPPSFTPASRTPIRGMVYYGTTDEEPERARLLPAAAGAQENEETRDEPDNTRSTSENGRVVERPPPGNPWASD